jgi:hypothetical protein
MSASSKAVSPLVAFFFGAVRLGAHSRPCRRQISMAPFACIAPEEVSALRLPASGPSGYRRRGNGTAAGRGAIFLSYCVKVRVSSPVRNNSGRVLSCHRNVGRETASGDSPQSSPGSLASLYCVCFTPSSNPTGGTKSCRLIGSPRPGPVPMSQLALHQPLRCIVTFVGLATQICPAACPRRRRITISTMRPAILPYTILF